MAQTNSKQSNYTRNHDPDYQLERKDVEGKSFLDKHPALNAVNASKKQGANFTAQYTAGSNITEKEKQLESYFPTVNMKPTQLKEFLDSYAENDPAKYTQIRQLATDIDTYYRNVAKKNHSLYLQPPRWQNIQTTANLAHNILSNKNNGFFVQTDKLEAKSLDLYKNILAQSARIPGMRVSDIIKMLHATHDAYKHEYALYSALPKEGKGTNNLKAASEKRLMAYIHVWGSLQQKISTYSNNNAQLLEFYETYKSNPLKPLTPEQTTWINKLIMEIKSKQAIGG